jgi:hypothetical protein
MEFGIDPRNSFPFQHGRVARQIPKNLIAQQTNKQTNKQKRKKIAMMIPTSSPVMVTGATGK